MRRAAGWISVLALAHFGVSFVATVFLTSAGRDGGEIAGPLSGLTRWLTNTPRLIVLDQLAQWGIDVGRTPSQMLISVVVHSVVWAVVLYGSVMLVRRVVTMGDDRAVVPVERRTGSGQG